MVRPPKVLHTGGPRTGSGSLQKALEILGYVALHTGTKPDLRAPACLLVPGNGTVTPGIQDLFNSADAFMDEPYHLLFPEFLQAVPDGKVIAAQRDPEAWYESFRTLIDDGFPWMLGRWPNWALLYTRLFKFLSPGFFGTFANNCEASHNPHCTCACYWGCDFYQAQTPALKAQCMRNFQEHHERVLREVPAERLLVFGPKDGWGPLCKFLGVPEPGVPFPNVAINAAGKLTQPIERSDVKLKPKSRPVWEAFLVCFVLEMLAVACICGCCIRICCCRSAKDKDKKDA